jgi:hypothetical protein
LGELGIGADHPIELRSISIGHRFVRVEKSI